MAGETGAIADSMSTATAVVIGGSMALSVYNSIEIFIITIMVGNLRTGLYFWGPMVANLAIPVHAVASMLRLFDLAPGLPMCVLVAVSWCFIVSGQSMLLYSRLHLVVGQPRVLSGLLGLTLAVLVVLVLPASALLLAINTEAGTTPATLAAFNIFEKLQLVGISVQEPALAGVYLYGSVYNLKPGYAINGGGGIYRLIQKLVSVLIVVVCLNSILVATQCAGFYHIQSTLRPIAYSIKLKVELLAFNDLTDVALSRTCYCSNAVPDECSRGGSKRQRPLRGSMAEMALSSARESGTDSPTAKTPDQSPAWDGWWTTIYDGTARERPSTVGISTI